MFSGSIIVTSDRPNALVTSWPTIRPSDYVSNCPSPYVSPLDRFGKTLFRILLRYGFPPPSEACESRVEGIATLYNSIMEHTATVVICKKNPNVSESGVNLRVDGRRPTKIYTKRR